MLACDRSCCYSLSHFLPFTYLLAYCHVRSVSPFILFSPLLHSHRNANPTQELAVIRSFRSISLFSLLGSMFFPALQIHVVAARFRFAAPSFTTAHIHPLPFIRCNTLHSFTPASPCFSHPQRSSKKVRQTGCRQHPATALRASRVRGTRSTRIGSHTTHRLYTSFRFSSLAFKPCYPRALKAVFTFGLNLLLPRQPPTTHPKYKCS